jgi:hypothetical protein
MEACTRTSGRPRKEAGEKQQLFVLSTMRKGQYSTDAIWASQACWPSLLYGAATVPPFAGAAAEVLPPPPPAHLPDDESPPQVKTAPRCRCIGALAGAEAAVLGGSAKRPVGSLGCRLSRSLIEKPDDGLGETRSRTGSGAGRVLGFARAKRELPGSRRLQSQPCASTRASPAAPR